MCSRGLLATQLVAQKNSCLNEPHSWDHHLLPDLILSSQRRKLAKRRQILDCVKFAQ